MNIDDDGKMVFTEEYLLKVINDLMDDARLSRNICEDKQDKLIYQEQIFTLRSLKRTLGIMEKTE